MPCPRLIAVLLSAALLATGLALSIVSPVRAAEDDDGVGGDPAHGLAIARQWCAACHKVAADQPRPMTQWPMPPPFAVLAKDRSKSDLYLRQFMGEKHLPMPVHRLTEAEKLDLLAYIRSLRPHGGN